MFGIRRRAIRNGDTCIAFEHVEKRDVLCGETRDERAADTILIGCELTAEQGLAPLGRHDSGIICELR